MGTFIAILISIIGGLSFLLFRSSKKNTTLKAEKDLTVQSARSKVVDDEVKDLEDKIEDLQDKIEEIPSDSEEFWKSYTKGKK